MSKKTKDWKKKYRGPIIGAVITVFVLTLWSMERLNRMHDRARDPLRRYAHGVVNTIDGTLFNEKNELSFNKNDTGQYFQRLVSQTPHLQCLYLIKNGRIICSAGELPNDTQIWRSYGQREEGPYLILWKRVGDYFLPPEKHQGGPGVQSPQGLGFGSAHPPRPGGGHPPLRPPKPYEWGTADGPEDLLSSDIVLVLAMSLRHGRFFAEARPDNSLAIFLVVALMATGILGAWAQSIRSSTLASELEKERTEREHLEELGLTAAGLAHETKNPIGIMLGLAQRIAKHPDDSDVVRNMAEQIQDAADRASGRLGEFLEYSRLREPKFEMYKADDVIERIAMALSTDFNTMGVTLTSQVEKAKLRCDKDMIGQVLVNLLLNSLHASSEGGEVKVDFSTDGNKGEIIVEDNGCGISEKLRGDVFKPYVTGKSNGHGLGLAITKRIIELHDWTISLETEEGRGTKFTLGNIEVTPMEEGQ